MLLLIGLYCKVPFGWLVLGTKDWWFGLGLFISDSQSELLELQQAARTKVYYHQNIKYWMGKYKCEKCQVWRVVWEWVKLRDCHTLKAWRLAALHLCDVSMRMFSIANLLVTWHEDGLESKSPPKDDTKNQHRPAPKHNQLVTDHKQDLYMVFWWLSMLFFFPAGKAG